MSNSIYNCILLFEFLYRVFQYGIQFNTMIKRTVLRKLLDKVGYFCLTRINPFDSSTTPSIAEYFAQFWNFLMLFLVLCDYDDTLMLKVCRMGVYYCKTKCSNEIIIITQLCLVLFSNQ